jgi:ABC-type multidrug transport system fused ATPase/permease subunit
LIAALLSFDINVPIQVIILMLVLAAVLPFMAIGIGLLIMKRRERKVANVQVTSGELTPRTISAIDASMNSNTVNIISSYAILLGILAFLGLTGAIIGFLASLANTKIYSPVTPTVRHVWFVNNIESLSDWFQVTRTQH